MTIDTVTKSIREFIFENKIVIFFALLVAFAYYHANVSTVFYFNELFIRFGRNTLMVLSLLIPVIAGLGLNFGIVLGAMSAQIAMFTVIVLGGSGTTGIFFVFAVALPIGIVFGYLVGKLFNSMKGSEMIGGMVLALFAQGFYMFLFLFVMGGIIPIGMSHVMTMGGVGVVNVINLNASPTYMRQAIDDVPMMMILMFAFWGALVTTVVTVAVNLIKKQPLRPLRKSGLLFPLLLLVPLSALYAMAFISPVVSLFLWQDRLPGLWAVHTVLYGGMIFFGYRIITHRFIWKKSGWPIADAFKLAVSAAAYAITYASEIYWGLHAVNIPVLTYLLIALICFFLTWFTKTRLGQNMRTCGQSREIANTAGINVDRTRVIAIIMSTVLAAFAHVVTLQNLGMMVTYDQHAQVGLYAIAAFLVGGATVTKAKVSNAIIGVILFHSLFILAPLAGANLMGSALIGEYFRVVAANGIIAITLIMHAWERVKTHKVAVEPAAPGPAGAKA